MAESRIPMKYRVPNRQLLEWSQRIVDAMEADAPKDRLEVYAREQVLLDKMQSTEIVVQAIRLGDIVIASTPNETYALTGLKLKAQSPFPKTMVIELANGADGYIPPPEQHLLGGYNTWAARSAGLEVTAEPRIVATAVNLLETVTQKPRRQPRETTGKAANQLLAAKPVAYYRFAETEPPVLVDQSGNHHDGVYEPGVCFYLPGPATPGQQYTLGGNVNRCVHFAGGRARTRLASLTNSYCVSMAFWNGMPNDARATTGWLLSNDYPHAISQNGEHLGISGSGPGSTPGRLMLQQGTAAPVLGKTEIPRWTWNHLLFVNDGKRLRVYLNKNPKPEIDVAIEPLGNREVATFFIGGRSDNQANFEGRIDEVAFFQGVPTDLVPQSDSSSK
ncbi:MAG: LamG domain-containing protein, partial [Rubripirellula sp.]|nr:LamG domain-containing protein [Rubripirellula sp.]